MTWSPAYFRPCSESCPVHPLARCAPQLHNVHMRCHEKKQPYSAGKPSLSYRKYTQNCTTENTNMPYQLSNTKMLCELGLKEQFHEIFDLYVLLKRFYLGPTRTTLKQFRKLFRFCKDIWLQSSKISCPVDSNYDAGLGICSLVFRANRSFFVTDESKSLPSIFIKSDIAKSDGRD